MNSLMVDMEVAGFSGNHTNLRDTAYHRLVPTRREMNRKICVSVTASIMFNTIAGFLVVLYILGTQTRVSQAEVSQGQFYEKQQAPPTVVTATKRRPYARLTVSVDKTTDKIIYWDEILGETPTMKYNNSEGSLLIPEDGYYIINLQVTYRNLTSSATSSNSEILMHHVMKRSVGYNQPKAILTVSEIMPPNRGYWIKTTHSTARVSLRKGQKLHVEFQFPNTYKLVDRGRTPGTKSFWGVYLDRDIN